MSDYTPTTGEVQDLYARTMPGWSPAEGRYITHMDAIHEFDRWLEQVKAEAWDEGHHAGQHNEHEYRPGRAMTNPYRTEKDA